MLFRTLFSLPSEPEIRASHIERTLANRQSSKPPGRDARIRTWRRGSDPLRLPFRHIPKRPVHWLPITGLFGSPCMSEGMEHPSSGRVRNRALAIQLVRVVVREAGFEPAQCLTYEFYRLARLSVVGAPPGFPWWWGSSHQPSCSGLLSQETPLWGYLVLHPCR